MSTHFWMIGGVTVAASAVMGLGLGGYVTSPQRSPLTNDMAIESFESAQSAGTEAADMPVQEGPAVIRCTGCGPTLADRRWNADMAALNDVSDAMPQDAEDELLAHSDYGSGREADGTIPHHPLHGAHQRPAPSMTPAPVQVVATVQQAPSPLSVPLPAPMEADRGESLP